MINIKKFLKDNADFQYAEFDKKFIATKYPILGVRMPILKKFAKEIEPEYIDFDENLTHEEILLYAYSAGQIKSEDEQLEYLQNLLPYIDNWATCDGAMTALKKCNGEKSFKFYMDLIGTDKEFYIRVGIVGLMKFFINSDKLPEILTAFKRITSSAYYVKMALAWFYAELCASNFPVAYQEISSISDKFIRYKAISKARESFRVSKDHKDELLSLKTKTKI